MFLTLLLLLVVPTTALGMVLGMDRLEESLLRHPEPAEVPAAEAVRA